MAESVRGKRMYETGKDGGSDDDLSWSLTHYHYFFTFTGLFDRCSPVLSTTILHTKNYCSFLDNPSLRRAKRTK